MSDLIRDPFDSSEAIMPSGNRGAKVFFAPLGTDPTNMPVSDDWKQVGWAEPGQFLAVGRDGGES
jgi:hypothetical protein